MPVSNLRFTLNSCNPVSSEFPLPVINCGDVYFKKISHYSSLFSFNQLDDCPCPIFLMDVFCLFEEMFYLRNPLRRSLGKFGHIPKLYQKSIWVIYSCMGSGITCFSLNHFSMGDKTKACRV